MTFIGVGAALAALSLRQQLVALAIAVMVGVAMAVVVKWRRWRRPIAVSFSVLVLAVGGPWFVHETNSVTTGSTPQPADSVAVSPSSTPTASPFPTLSSGPGQPTGSGTGSGEGPGGGPVLTPTTAPPTTGGAPTGNPKTADLFENWSGAIDRWQKDSSAIVITGGQVRLNSVANVADYYNLEAKARYDLASSHVTTELVSAGDQSGSFDIVPISVGEPDKNEVRWEITGNQVFARVIRNGVTTEVGGVASYNASAYRFLSISENGGTFSWAYSSNGSTWSTYATAPVQGMALNAVRIRQYGGTWAADPDATVAIFDNFNCRANGMPNKC